MRPFLASVLTCACILPCTGGTGATAAEAGRLRLRVNDCLDLALAHSFSLKAAAREREVASGLRAQAWSELLPTLEGGAGAERSQAGETAPSSTRETELRITQPLFKGGRIRARLRISELEALRAREVLRQARQQVCLQACLAYWHALLARELVKVARKQADLAGEQLQTARARVQRGLAGVVEVNRAEVELTRKTNDLLRARNDADLAANALRVLLGTAEKTELVLVEPFPGRAREPAAPDLEAALAARPDVRLAEIELAVREQEVRAVRAELLPEVSAAGSWGASAASGRDWQREWRLGVAVRLPLFEGMETRGRLRVARARREQATMAVGRVKDLARREVRESWLNLRTAARLMRSLAASTQKAEAYLADELARSRKGANTYLDVLNSLNSLADTQRNYLRALHDYAVARCRLSRAVGTIGEEDPGREATPAGDGTVPRVRAAELGR